jgi:hypothetical protein
VDFDARVSRSVDLRARALVAAALPAERRQQQRLSGRVGDRAAVVGAGDRRAPAVTDLDREPASGARDGELQHRRPEQRLFNHRNLLITMTIPRTLS